MASGDLPRLGSDAAGSAASPPLGAGAGGGREGGRQGEGRGPGTWERELVEDAGSTAAELAYAAPERTSGMRNAAEAIRGLAALRIDGSCSASPPPPRGPPFCLAPCKVGANSGSPPRAPRPQYGSFLRGALKEESKKLRYGERVGEERT